MRKSRAVLSMLVVAALFGCWAPQAVRADEAAELKPLAEVVFSGYSETMKDLAVVGNLAERPGIPEFIEASITLATEGKGLAGLDKKRPWGAVVSLDGEKAVGCAMIPVTKLDDVMEMVRVRVADVEAGDDGVYKVPARQKTLFVVEQNGWAIVADSREALKSAPQNPAKLFGSMGKQYDLAVRLHVSNVPKDLRAKAINKLKAEAAKQMEMHPPRNDQEKMVREVISKQVLREISGALNEIDTVSLGWSLDNQAQSAALEVEVTALPGTAAAKRIAALGKAKSQFSGFFVPGAAVAGNWAGPGCCPLRGSEQRYGVFDAIQAEVAKKIDQKVPDSRHAEAAKEIASGLLLLAEKNLGADKVDGGASLVLNPDGITLVAGRFIADGDLLEDTLARLVEAARDEAPGFVDEVLTTNVAQYKGYEFHKVSVEIPPMCPERELAVKLFGESAELVVGLAPKAVCVGIGKDALKSLKKAIDGSQGKDKTPAAARWSVDASKIAEFVAAVGKGRDKKNAEKVLAALKTAPEKDHVNLTVSATGKTARLRFEVEQGVLKAIATARDEED